MTPALPRRDVLHQLRLVPHRNLSPRLVPGPRDQHVSTEPPNPRPNPASSFSSRTSRSASPMPPPANSAAKWPWTRTSATSPST